MNQFRPRGGFGAIPPVVKNLLIINVLVYISMHAIQSAFNYDISQNLALFFFKSEYFKPFQFISHMFMHSSFSIGHIFFNMFALWMFGRVLEQVWGSKRFLIYYFFTGLGAAALHMLVMHIEFLPMIKNATALANTPSPELFESFIRDQESFIRNRLTISTAQLYEFVQAWSRDPSSSAYAKEAVTMAEKIVQLKINVPTVGASGAVYGVLLAFGMIFPNMPLVLIFFPFFPIKAKYMVMGMGVLELIYGFSMSGSNVAHFAHLGGMIFGFILIKYWNTSRQDFY